MHEMRSSVRRNRRIGPRSDSSASSLLQVITGFTIAALITFFAASPLMGERVAGSRNSSSPSGGLSSPPPGKETRTSAEVQDLLDKMRLLCAKGDLLRTDGEYKRAEKRF